jgi:5'-nucleotidase
MDGPDILLTNDDGIDSPGLRALSDALSNVGTVTVVAPADDQSAVGRSISSEVSVSDHDLGYAVAGTPADCVVAGLEALAPQTDLVVSGCNDGANLGAYVLGRSGTVSAAVEAAFFDVPAVAVSQYVAVAEDVSFRDHETSVGDYAAAARAATHLARRAPAADVFSECDFLNVNVPDPGTDVVGMEVTRPSRVYDMGADRSGSTVTLSDRLWKRMAAGDVPDPAGTDRRAVLDGKVSVSPLTAPHATEHHDALDALADRY